MAMQVAEFPLDEIEARVDHILEYLPDISAFLVEKQPELSIERSTKSADDLKLMQTADIEVEKRLLDCIMTGFEDDEIHSEEAGEAGRQSDFSWWIDPVDGTRNYIHGLPTYCISIGLSFRESPVAGVVSVPAMKDTYQAIYGSGAYRNDQPISVSSIETMDRALVTSGLPYNRKDIITRLISDISAFVSSGIGLRRTGSVVLDLCYIADGKFDAMWERGVDPWDTCGASVILREAGGRISGFGGEIFDPSMQDIVASNQKLHSDMLEVLKQAREIESIN